MKHPVPIICGWSWWRLLQLYLCCNNIWYVVNTFLQHRKIYKHLVQQCFQSDVIYWFLDCDSVSVSVSGKAKPATFAVLQTTVMKKQSYFPFVSSACTGKN